MQGNDTLQYGEVTPRPATLSGACALLLQVVLRAMLIGYGPTCGLVPCEVDRAKGSKGTLSRA